jgi:thiamine biosynthesis lipoprotein
LFEKVKIELLRIERKFSSYHPDSLVTSLNKSAGTGSFTAIDPESRSLLEYVTLLWDNSSHLFDPTTRLLQECYDPDGRLLASPEQLKGMLQLVGWPKVEIGESGARLTRKGMLIDLNSCVRPYAIDSAKKILLRAGVAHAMIEMKRDIATIGKQPDGSNWLVGVRLPRQSRSAITRLKLNNRSFALRGNFERCSIQSGERFGRALSPIDGQPIPGPLSVATVAESCLAACSAASIARLKTEGASLSWLEDLDYPWLAVDRNLACHGSLVLRA